jgi:Tat protein secretion system quality control protein TatD with DNase activity
VGINLGDPVFRGIYHGKRGHEDDLEQVVQRALDVGCMKLMVTGSDLKESAHALDLAKQFRRQRLSCRGRPPLTKVLSWHLLRYSRRPSMREQRV